MANFFNRLFRSPETSGSAPVEDPADPATEAAAVESSETTPTEPEYTFDDLKNEPFAGDLAQEDPAPTIPETPATLEVPEVIGGGAVSEQDSNPASPELMAFKKFFNLDLRIKQDLMSAAPSPADDFDEASRMRSVDNLYDAFRSFRHDFQQIADGFGLGGPKSYVTAATDEFFRRGQENFAVANYAPGVAERLYRQNFSDMRESFVEQIKKDFAGYTLFKGSIDQAIEKATTVNELLHAYHSYIMNNESFLQKVPAIAEKTNANRETITLRGEHNELGQDIFDSILEDLDIGVTDIVAVDNRAMMMVRDRGHALTIDSDIDPEHPDQVYVHYHIPKICNRDMVAALPGVGKITDNGASGVFVVKKSNAGQSIAEFISRVPTDLDMSRPGGPFYRPAE